MEELTNEEKEILGNIRKEAQKKKETECNKSNHNWKFIKEVEIPVEKKSFFGKKTEWAYLFVCPDCGLTKKIITD